MITSMVEIHTSTFRSMFFVQFNLCPQSVLVHNLFTCLTTKSYNYFISNFASQSASCNLKIINKNIQNCLLGDKMVPKCTLQHPQWGQNEPSEGPKRCPKLMCNSYGAQGCSKGSSRGGGPPPPWGSQIDTKSSL